MGDTLAIIGDPAAIERQRFARFVAEHAGVVFASAYAATGDRALSEEIAQEAFLIAWRKLPRLAAPPAMPAWVCGIARHLARNARRRRRRECAMGEGAAARSPLPV
jgi:zinc protease